MVAFSSKVPHLHSVEVGKVADGKQVWQPDGSLLQWWSRSMIELLLLLLLWLLLLEVPRLELWAIARVLLLLRSAQLTPRWGIHHAVLVRSIAKTTTASGSRHDPLPLLFIGLSNSLHHPLLINDCTRQLIVQQAGELYQAFLQVDGESCMVQVGLLLIRVDVVQLVLGKCVELARVVEYTMVPLLTVQKLLPLGVE
jgi:hypothetical protein